MILGRFQRKIMSNKLFFKVILFLKQLYKRTTKYIVFFAKTAMIYQNSSTAAPYAAAICWGRRLY